MNYQATSLRTRGSASTVALHLLMEQAQKLEIGQRIRALREDSAETNRSIADYCDVSVEAVRNWIAGKGIAYDNGEKVAEMFSVRFDWLWRGKGEQHEAAATPDLMGEFSPDADLLRAVAAQVAVVVAAVERIEAQLQGPTRTILKRGGASGE